MRHAQKTLTVDFSSFFSYELQHLLFPAMKPVQLKCQYKWIYKKRSLILNVSLWWPPMLNEDRSSMNPGKHSSWEIHPALLFSKPYAILPFLELHRTLKINIIIVVSMYFNIIFWCGLLMLYFGSSSTGDRGEWKLSSVVNVTFTDMNSSVWQDSGSGGLGHTRLFKSIWNCPNHCYNGCSRAE